MLGKRFWCGFCRDVFEVDEGGNGDWYAVRAEHVGSHFTGDAPATFVAGMEDWTDVFMYRPEA